VGGDVIITANVRSDRDWQRNRHIRSGRISAASWRLILKAWELGRSEDAADLFVERYGIDSEWYMTPEFKEIKWLEIIPKPRTQPHGGYLPRNCSASESTAAGWQVLGQDPWLQNGHKMATDSGRAWAAGRPIEFTIGSGPGIRTLNLAVNRSLHPCSEIAVRVPRPSRGAAKCRALLSALLYGRSLVTGGQLRL